MWLILLNPPYDVGLRCLDQAACCRNSPAQIWPIRLCRNLLLGSNSRANIIFKCVMKVRSDACDLDN